MLEKDRRSKNGVPLVTRWSRWSQGHCELSAAWKGAGGTPTWSQMPAEQVLGGKNNASNALPLPCLLVLCTTRTHLVLSLVLPFSESQVFLPPLLLCISAMQMVSFAFGPAIPWKKTVKQPAVVTHQARDACDAPRDGRRSRGVAVCGVFGAATWS